MYEKEKHDVYLSILDQSFEDFFSKFFDDSRRNLKTLSKNVAYPKVDIYTQGEFYTILSTIPGVQQKNLKIEIDGNILTISGKMSLENVDNAEFYIKELKRSSFSRDFILPDSLIGEPNVVFDNCILRLTWKCKSGKKKQAESKKKVIEINKQAIREEIYTGPSRKNLTSGKKYGILRETDSFYIILDDLDTELKIDPVFFDAVTPGIKFTTQDPVFPNVLTLLEPYDAKVKSTYTYTDEDFLQQQLLSEIITRDEYEKKKQDAKDCKIREAKNLVERDIFKYEIFNELGLVSLPKEIGNKIKLHMTNGKAYGIFDEFTGQGQGQEHKGFKLFFPDKSLDLATKVDFVSEHKMDQIQTFYFVLNDIGEKAVIPAYCFDAIPQSMSDDCAKLFDTFSNINVGLSCEKGKKYKKSGEQCSIVDTCFNGKETDYLIKTKGKIIPNTLSGSVYVGKNLVCKFMSAGNLDNLTLTHTDGNDIKVKSIALLQNFTEGQINLTVNNGGLDRTQSNIHYNLKIDWFIVPGKTKVAVDYDYEYEAELLFYTGE